MPEMNVSISPSEIAERGQRIYDEQYRQALEQNSTGKFVAIDVQSGAAVVGESPLATLENARSQHPRGLFHLIKIGSSGVYRAGSASTRARRGDWVFT